MPDRAMRADARRNRDAIIAAARTAFANGGFGLRFDDFAGLAGVGTGTLYRHFPTREALAAAVYREEVTAVADRARELSDTLSPLDALRTYLHEFIDYLDAHQGLAYSLVAASESDAVLEGGRAIETAISSLVERAAAARTIRDDVDAGVVLIALHGITASADRPEWLTAAHGLITLVIDGLEASRENEQPERLRR